jgi:hypothetical protein
VRRPQGQHKLAPSACKNSHVYFCAQPHDCKFAVRSVSLLTRFRRLHCLFTPEADLLTIGLPFVYLSMTDSCSIQANPDIAGRPLSSDERLNALMRCLGIGTRAAFYLQSVVVLLATAVSTSVVLRDKTDSHETSNMMRENQRKMSISFIVLGLMLVISAVIQKLTFGLSIYHAFIVSGLSWMTVFTAMPAYFSLGTYQSEWRIIVRAPNPYIRT